MVFFIFIQILIKEIVRENSGDSDQMQHSVVSDLFAYVP